MLESPLAQLIPLAPCPHTNCQERGIAYQPYGATPKATPGGTSGTEGGMQDGDEYDALGVLAEAKKLADVFAPSLLEVSSMSAALGRCSTAAIGLPVA